LPVSSPRGLLRLLALLCLPSRVGFTFLLSAAQRHAVARPAADALPVRLDRRREGATLCSSRILLWLVCSVSALLTSGCCPNEQARESFSITFPTKPREGAQNSSCLASSSPCVLLSERSRCFAVLQVARSPRSPRFWTRSTRRTSSSEPCFALPAVLADPNCSPVFAGCSVTRSRRLT
jgi:hypothetical protein